MEAVLNNLAKTRYQQWSPLKVKLQGIVDTFTKLSKKNFCKVCNISKFCFSGRQLFKQLVHSLSGDNNPVPFWLWWRKICLNIDTPYLSAFSPNAGKYRPEKTPYLDIFHAEMCRRHLSNKLLNKFLSKLFLRLFRSPQKKPPGVFYKKVFLKILQYSLENICAGASF